MSDTQVLLNRIVSLRQRLEVVTGERRRTHPHPSLPALQSQVLQGAENNALLDATLRQLPDTAAPGEDLVLPTYLTTRARRILERGRELLGRLRDLDEALRVAGATDADDPLTRLYREAATMANTTLRMLQALPDAPSVQLRLCEGLEAFLNMIDRRLGMIAILVENRRNETHQVERLSELLTALVEGREPNIKPFVALAEAVLAEAQQSAPLRFLHGDPGQPARFVACHSLNVGQVIARVVRHDPELRARPMEAVLAALVHDAGMLRVPPEILTNPGPLDTEGRRAIERHCRTGADLALRLLPSGDWLAEATAGHHERLDGTGYPNGLRDLQISALTRLLTVCDIYAATCVPRPYRPACDTRTALADTLVLAEQGLLDHYYAEQLLQLSFYPVGSVVELTDGAVAAVLATHPTSRDLSVPARPVLALLTDAQGRALAMPQSIDLAQCEGHAIVRALSPIERRQVLGGCYPEFV